MANHRGGRGAGGASLSLSVSSPVKQAVLSVVERLQAELNAANTERLAISSKLAAATSELSATKAALSRANADKARRRVEVDELGASVTELREQLERQTEDHEQALAEAKLEQRRTEERVARGEEAYAALEDDLAGANAELDRTHVQLRAARDACAAAEAAAEDERARHERELAQLRGVWEAAVEDVDRNHREMEEDAAALRARVEELEAQGVADAAAHARARDELHAALRAANAACDRSKGALASARARGDKLATREALLRQKLVELEAEREAADAARAGLGTRLADEERAKASVETALEHAELRLARRADELECLRGELDPLIERHLATLRRVKARGDALRAI